MKIKISFSIRQPQINLCCLPTTFPIPERTFTSVSISGMPNPLQNTLSADEKDYRDALNLLNLLLDKVERSRT